MLHASRVDGLLIYPTTDMRPNIEAAVSRGLPVVHLFRDLPLGDGLGCDGVLIDEGKVVEEATRRLIELGHRRIALVTLPPDSISGPARLEGYRLAHRTHGVKVDADLVCIGQGTVVGGYELTAAALSRTPRPTALVVTTSLHMIGAVQTVQAKGLRRPQDISMVGSNPTMPLAPGLAFTVWDYPVDELAHLAVDVFLERLSAGPSAPPRRLVL